MFLRFFLMMSFFASISTTCFAQTTVEEPAPIQQKVLTHPNSTSYTFSIPLNKLRDTVIKMFGIDPQMDNKTLEDIFYYNWPETGNIHKNQAMFFPETSDSTSFGIDYFKMPGTKENIFLTPMADYWYSTKYYYNNKPFEYTSSYAIEFKSLDSIQTTITIKSIGGEIFNGTLCCNPHSPTGHYSNTQPVSPTTVEEYTLILFIAEKLGIKGLQPLELPK